MSASTPNATSIHSVVIHTTLLKDWLTKVGLSMFLDSQVFYLAQLVLGHNYLRFDISQNLFVRIVHFCMIFQEIRSREGFWSLQSASIDHGCRFRWANGALWSIRFNEICFAGLRGVWGTLSANGLLGGFVFAAQQPPDLTTLRAPSRPSSPSPSHSPQAMRMAAPKS